MSDKKNRFMTWLLSALLCFSNSFAVIQAEEESPQENGTSEVTEQEEITEEVTEAEETPEPEQPEITAEEEVIPPPEVTEAPEPEETAEPEEPEAAEEPEISETMTDDEEPELEADPDAVFTRLEVTVLPTAVKYQVGDTVDLTGIELSAWTDEGTCRTVSDPAEIELISYDTSKSGVNTVQVGYAELTAEYSIQVHTVYEHRMILLDSETYPESAHNYGNSANIRYPFTYSGAKSLTLVFSTSTQLESGYDNIYLYDGSDEQIGAYTGTSLAGQTVVVPGDTVVILLTSDSSVTFYGFSLDSITAEIYNVEHEHTEPGTFTPAACFTDAFTTYICSVCGEEYVITDEGTAHHEYENGFCKHCGTVENAVSSGMVSETAFWSVSEDGTLYVSGSGEIPAKMKWDLAPDTISSVVIRPGITDIGEYAFQNFSNMGTISLPEGLKSIGNYAFANCSALQDLPLPEGLESVGYRVLNNCSGVTELTVPSTLTTFGYYSGNGMLTGSSVKNVTVASGVETIPYAGFYSADKLESVSLPESVTTIGDYAFQDCTKLVSITLPQGLTSLGRNAFYNCRSLPALNIPAGVTAIREYTFYYCSSLTELTGLEGVSSIGEYAFQDCSKLASFTMPQGLTSLGRDAFYNCSSLTKMNVPAGVTVLSDYTFYGCSSLTEVTLPDTLTSIGAYAFSYNTVLPEIDLPSSLTYLGNYAFQHCRSITEIELPASLARAGYYVFSDCTSLTSLTIPAALTSFSNNGFLGESSIREVTFAEGTTAIASYALYNAKKVVKVNIPETVTSIGSYAFYSCYALADISLPEGVNSLGSYAFYNCRALPEITIPAGVTLVPYSCFYGCSSLTKAELPETVTNVDQYAFYNCTSLAEITVAAGQKLGSYAYENCSGAHTLTIGDNAVIGNYAFRGCTGLRTVHFGTGISFGTDVFSGVVISGSCGEGATYSLNMSDGTLSVEGVYLMADYSPESPAPWHSFAASIKKLEIAGTIDGIGAWAFADCVSLESVVLPDGVKVIGESAFRGCTSLYYVEIPDGIQSIGDDAFAGCMAFEQAVFMGDAPSLLGFNCFGEKIISIFYPETGSGFTERLFNKFVQNAWILWDDTVPSKEIVLLLDTSGSMEGKTGTLSSAATELITSIGGAVKKTKISVVRYDSSATTLNGFTTDPVTLKRSVASLYANGGTDYHNALSRARSLLSGSKADIRSVIMFSDGEPNDSIPAIYSLASSMQEDTMMYTVGLLSSQEQRDVLINVAGSESRYFEATDIQGLVSAFIELSENFGRDEETTAVIKRHGVRHDLFAEEQELCLNSDELVTIYITPGTAEKYAAVDSIAIKQGDRILMRNKSGIFEGIDPSAYFEYGLPVYSVLLDVNGNTIEEKELLLTFRESYYVTYMWGTEGSERQRIYMKRTFVPGADIEEPATPVKKYYKFKGWYASPACEGYEFFNIFNIYNRLNIENDIVLYPKWVRDKSTLQFGVDTFSFLNHSYYFGNGKYDMTSGDYARLMSTMDLLNLVDRAAVALNKSFDWGGSCFGMSSVVVLGADGSFDISRFDPEASAIGYTSLTENSDGDNDVGDVESMINFYHLRQKIGSIQSLWMFYNPFTDSPNLKKIIETMKRTETPVLLTIRPGSGGHAVVGFDLEETQGGYTFKVYDCSLYPYYSRDPYIVNVTVRDGHYSAECDAWENAWEGDIFFQCALTADDLKGIPYLVAPNTLDRTLGIHSSETGYFYLETGYDSFTITDGQRSAVIADSSLSSGDLNITCYGNVSEPGYTPRYRFLIPALPNGRYEITQSGSGSFQTVMYDTDLANGFLVTESADVPGTVSIGADGSVRTSYASPTEHSISVCVNRMSTPWYNVTISGTGTGFNVTPGSETVSVIPDEDTNITVKANSDFNELTLTDVPVTTGGVTVLEGADDVCEVRDNENVLAAQGLYGFSVVFDSQFGSGVSTLFNVAYGSLIGEPEDPSREGYIFEGWYKDEAHTEPWNFETDTVTADTILYAGWSVNPNYLASVTFRVPGSEDEVIYLPKRTVIPAEYAPKAADGTDLLWYTQENYSGNPWDFAVDILTESMVLYGKTGQCVVSFVTGVEQTIPDLTVYYGQTVKEPAGLDWEGHTLCSWYADPEFKVPWDFTSDLVKENMTLYARWLENIRDKNGTDTGICIEIVGENSLVYTGKPVTPAVVVRDDGQILTAGKDYSLTFKNNTNACDKESTAVKASKKPQLIVTGKGNYKSAKKITLYFTIAQADLGELDITVPGLVAAKAKNALQKVKPTVKTEKASVPASAYTVRYYTDDSLADEVKGITAPGTYYLILEAKKNEDVYTGNLCGMAGPFTVTAAESAKLLSSAAKITVPKTIQASGTLLAEDEAVRTLITKVTIGRESFLTDEENMEVFRSCFEVSAVDSDGTAVPQEELGRILQTIGTKTVTVSAREGNDRGFVGEKSVKVSVRGSALKKTDFLVTFGAADKPAVLKSEYSGLSQVPGVFTSLMEDEDYTVSYRKGKKEVSALEIKKPGSYSAVITGTGSRSGTLTYAFSITKVDLATAYSQGRIRIEKVSQAVQSLSGAAPVFSVSFVNQKGNRIRLAEGVDYTIKYANNKTANEKASATITGKGGFSGSLTKAKAPELGFSIEKKPLTDPEITVSVEGITWKNGTVTGVKHTLYDGSKKIPAKEYSSTMEEGETHIVLTITAKDINYTGTREITVQKTLIKAGDTKKVKAAIEGGTKYYYTGSSIRPDVTILDAEGQDISDCFTVVYGTNKNVGTGTVRLLGDPGKGYYGTRTLKFTILPKWLQWLFG